MLAAELGQKKPDPQTVRRRVLFVLGERRAAESKPVQMLAASTFIETGRLFESVGRLIPFTHWLRSPGESLGMGTNEPLTAEELTIARKLAEVPA